MHMISPTTTRSIEDSIPEEITGIQRPDVRRGCRPPIVAPHGVRDGLKFIWERSLGENVGVNPMDRTHDR
jgi:hypothetical protein